MRREDISLVMVCLDPEKNVPRFDSLPRVFEWQRERAQRPTAFEAADKENLEPNTNHNVMPTFDPRKPSK